MTVATVGSVEIREMVRIAHTEDRALCIETNSGSVYYLHPMERSIWRIVRRGCEGGRVTTHHGVVQGANQGRDLQIGPWITTGLKDIYVL